MKTKIILITIFAFIFWKKVNAQYAIAGSTVGIYTDIVPDTLIQANKSYYIDINQDSINDIKIATYYYYASGPSGYPIVSVYTKAFALINNLCLCFWKTICNEQNLLMPFDTGSVIDKNNNYVNSGYMSFGESYVVSNGTGSPSQESCSNWEWADSTSHYIGVRYATNIDTAYGWIRVSVNTDQVIINDFDLERNPIVGIGELTMENLQLTIYPNPANEMLSVESKMLNGQAEVQIIDVLGKVIKNSTLRTKNSQIDVSSLLNGIYFAQIKTDKGVGTKKFVVQR